MTDQIDNTESNIDTSTENNVETTSNEINKESSSNTESPSFIDQIQDEELKTYVSKAGYKDINGVIKSAMHLEKKLGAPKEPESFKPEQYSYELPENYQANEEIINPVKEKAIELGIKPEAFKELVETFAGKENEILQQMQQSQKEQSEQLQETLKQEWGNKYDENLALADKTWTALTTEAEDKILENLPKDAQLAIAKVMVNVASQISEPSVGRQQGSTGVTKEQALEKIEAINKDNSLSYEEKQNKLFPLYNIAYANEKFN